MTFGPGKRHLSTPQRPLVPRLHAETHALLAVQLNCTRALALHAVDATLAPVDHVDPAAPRALAANSVTADRMLAPRVVVICLEIRMKKQPLTASRIPKTLYHLRQQLPHTSQHRRQLRNTPKPHHRMMLHEIYFIE